MSSPLHLRFEMPPPEVIGILRTKPSGERLEMAYAMHRFARERLTAHLKFSRPEWSDQ